MPPSLFTYLIDVNNKQEIINLIPLLEVQNQVEEHLSHSTNTSSVEIFNREQQQQQQQQHSLLSQASWGRLEIEKR
jgi:hypothetical protein